MNIARVAVLLLAVGAAGGAYYFSQMMKPASAPSAPAAAQAPVMSADVLVAAHDISIGKLLAQDDLTWQAWPKDAVASGMLRKDENPKIQDEIVGSIARTSILAGEPIRRERLVKGPNAGFLSAILPSGMRAVAINIDAQGSTSAGGFILPNDRVDVIRTIKPEGNTGGDLVSETLLRNVKVLAIGQNVQEKNGEPVVVGSTATLELDPSQSETIILAQRTGQLSLVLRSMLDANVDTAAPEKRDDGSTTIVRFGVQSEAQGH